MPEQPSGETPQEQTDGAQPESFDTWLGAQPEPIRQLASQHTAGLKSALEAERAQRKELAKQLKETLGKAEQGSEAAKALGELTAKYEQAERRAAFYEDAGRPEIGCSNPKAAFLIANADDLFTRSGEPDWKAIRAAAPELFARRGGADAGAGTTAPPKGTDMNTFIRRAAGRA